MIGRNLQTHLGLATWMFMIGVSHSAFKHYYNRYADTEDLNDGTITQVKIVSDETKKKGRKK
tara:strand:- start:345 stop:530 length:186 start_codon:yes stop_codon:yes gene_type:complete